MIKSREVNGNTVYDLLSFDFEDDFSKIVEVLSTKYEVAVTNKLEGPDTTIWDVSISGHMFYMVNNNWGSYLKPFNDDAKQFIEREMSMLNAIL
jgi:hypothetical protein